MKDILRIDLETRSDIDISKAGAYRYAASPEFRILLFGFSFNGSASKVIDLTEVGDLPLWLQEAVQSPEVSKHAFYAAFEWICLSKYFRYELPIDHWRDTMLHAMYCGFPASLDAAGRALGLPEDKQKLRTGKVLIRYFCTPCAPTKANGARPWNEPYHDPEKWELFREYCAQDVTTEAEIDKALESFPVPEQVQREWETDMRINSRGVYMDMHMVQGALELDKRVREGLLAEAVSISRLSNPNSVAQLTSYLEAEMDAELPNLSKDTVSKLLDREGHSDGVRRMLEIRRELCKTSTKKYNAIEAVVCPDGRSRGLLRFYGANRTGRWAGKLIQVQNLPRTYIEPLDLARDLVKDRKLDALKMIWGSVPDTLSQLIRTTLTASPDHVFIDADFSAIEARVVAWLAGEEWVLDVFRTTGKIYEATAAQLYGVPFEKIKKGNPEYAYRQYGKAATLALGYGGGAQALINVGHLAEDTPVEELEDLKTRWRAKSPNIVRFWYDCDEAAKLAVNTGKASTVGRVTFSMECDRKNSLRFLTVTLPSGRKMFYPSPEIGTNRFGSESLTYMGQDQTTKKWKRIETYGGKLVENITQAVARDCLAHAIERLESKGFPIIFHVHDEVVIDIKPYAEDEKMLKDVTAIMSVPPMWACGLPLNAEGWVGAFFKKD